MTPEGEKEQPGRVFQGAGLPEGGNHGHYHSYQVLRYVKQNAWVHKLSFDCKHSGKRLNERTRADGF
jgi:hypothetical protein